MEQVRETPIGPTAPGTAAMPTHRSYWVVEGRLMGGAYPFDADPDNGRVTLARLARAGITDFVDLTEAGIPGTPDAHLGRYEPELDGSAARHSRPITDLTVASQDNVMETLDLIDALLAEDRNVYVHCWGGIGRTGTIIGCWLRRHDVVPAGEVLGFLAGLRRQDRLAAHLRSPETDDQCAFVEAWPAGR